MMSEESAVTRAQAAYQAAVDEWIAAIRTEEQLAYSTDSIAHIDQWEHAHYVEEAARDRALLAKKSFEAALREKFFQF